MMRFSTTTHGSVTARDVFLSDVDASIARLGKQWSYLRNAQLFITGGTGYIGRWLLETLVRANELHGLNLNATVLTRSPEAFLRTAPELARTSCIQFHLGDVRDFSYPQGTFTHVIHGAATSAGATYHQLEDPLTKFETTFDGTRRTLEFAVARKVPRFLMLGSGSLYGPMAVGQQKYVENHDSAPSLDNMTAAMGHAKRSAEFLTACYGQRYGISISTARCFTFAGPYLPLDMHYALGNFVRDALWNDSITVAGDGTPVRSYLFTGDLVVWLITLLLAGQAGLAYNVGSDQAISIGDLARLVGSRVAPKKEVRVLAQSTSGISVHRYVPDISRARKALGLDVWTSLEQAIDRTALFASKANN
ncbi:NAD(P)-dependent oxidoreductase [Rhodoferax sp. U11-2br]|uniref:NAD-dependent epimerase/dehydratase family protein n=1 Tax=Rhodoferax sp. U11-2br TaxID=2838878 RepID=UPI001BE870A2|nr:NAD(P)-dependent oxidoreductase [Rhodoferax sp. U11-2br]MBT3067574.1 NAD(P)-dependent oxidoreductase [Rhodoferax sp. U11-2br]